jgi:hypothetical protein
MEVTNVFKILQNRQGVTVLPGTVNPKFNAQQNNDIIYRFPQINQE